ncbi:MAG: protein arginine N-methyltransferase 1 [Verrucomicrobiales bacterium]|jgi:protein arginine N-methyltransferase 1
MGAYSKAIRETVRPGDVVVDIGAGTGIFSFLACQAGARKVYAIEPNDAAFLGRELTRTNGFTDRIEWFQKLSTDVELPEKADVVVADLRGILPFFSPNIRTLADAKKRFLKPEGTLIPRTDTIWAALYSNRKAYDSFVAPWGDNSFGLNWTPYTAKLSDGVYKCRADAGTVMSAPQQWARIDYGICESDNFEGSFEFEVLDEADCHGLLIWFDATLADGVSFSGGPGAPEMVYGSALLPFGEPVSCRRGEHVKASVRVRELVGDCVWHWNANFADRALPTSFQHTTGKALLPSPAALRAGMPDAVPGLTNRATLLWQALDRLRAKHSIGDVTRELATDYPDQLPTENAAREFLASHVLPYNQD